MLCKMANDFEFLTNVDFDSEEFAQLIKENVDLESEVDGDDFLCFNCLGEVSVEQIQFCSKSYLNSNEATKYVDMFLNVSSPNKKCCRILLFGKSWDKGSALYKHLNTFFKMFSQELMLIEKGAKLSVNNSLGMNISKLSTNRNEKTSRIYCVEFFHFIRSFVRRDSKACVKHSERTKWKPPKQ